MPKVALFKVYEYQDEYYGVGGAVLNSQGGQWREVTQEELDMLRNEVRGMYDRAADYKYVLVEETPVLQIEDVLAKAYKRKEDQERERLERERTEEERKAKARLKRIAKDADKRKALFEELKKEFES